MSHRTMHRGKVLTVRVEKRPLDDIKVDATFTDVATPDPTTRPFRELRAPSENFDAISR